MQYLRVMVYDNEPIECAKITFVNVIVASIMICN